MKATTKISLLIIALLLCISSFAYYKPNIAAKSNVNDRGLPVLMYHFFYDKQAGEKGPNKHWVEISDFEKQMKYLHDNNYYFPTWDEVYDFVVNRKPLPKKSIIITIDDGAESVFRLALPVLEKYNIRATIFAITSFKVGQWIPQYASPTVIFQSHTHDMHRRDAKNMGVFLTTPKDEAKEDLLKSIEIVGSKDAFCYPFGHYNKGTKKSVKEVGFKLAFTTVKGKVYPGMDRLLLPRIKISNGDNLDTFINKIK